MTGSNHDRHEAAASSAPRPVPGAAPGPRGGGGVQPEHPPRRPQALAPGEELALQMVARAGIHALLVSGYRRAAQHMKDRLVGAISASDPQVTGTSVGGGEMKLAKAHRLILDHDPESVPGDYKAFHARVARADPEGRDLFSILGRHKIGPRRGVDRNAVFYSIAQQQLGAWAAAEESSGNIAKLEAECKRIQQLGAEIQANRNAR